MPDRNARMKQFSWLLMRATLLVLLATGCRSAYYAAWEKVGVFSVIC